MKLSTNSFPVCMIKDGLGEVHEDLNVCHMPGLLALEFWGGENLVSVHSVHCEMVVSMSHCDDVSVKTKSFKVDCFGDLPALCVEVADFICQTQRCITMSSIVRELRVCCQLDEKI